MKDRKPTEPRMPRTKVGQPDAAANGKPGVDLDLMRLLDGELDGDARTDVQAAVDRDPTKRAKLSALRLAGELLREEALRRAEGADGIADLVMARIQSEANDAGAATVASTEVRADSGKVTSLRRGSRPEIAPPSAAANDNGAARRIYALAVAAVAVAAGLMIWGKMEPPAPTALPSPAPIESASPTPSAVARGPVDDARPRASGSRTDEGPEGGENDVGVQVAAVDFGARGGSIFYVPTQGRTTTVVWLADDLAGGE